MRCWLAASMPTQYHSDVTVIDSLARMSMCNWAFVILYSMKLPMRMGD